MKYKKPLLALLLIISFSCKKNTETDLLSSIKNVSVIPSNVLFVTDVVYQIPKDLALQENEWGTDAIKATYKKTLAVTYRLNSKLMQGRSLMIYEYKGRHFATLITVVQRSVNINKYKITNLDGLEYYSLLLNRENAIDSLVITNPVPFNLLLPNTQTSTQRAIPFSTCMHNHWVRCTDSWTCSIACGLALLECVAGMSLACAAVSDY